MFSYNFPNSERMLSLPERTGALPHLTGRGVVMAFIDSGFYAHPDILDRVLIHADATTNRIIEGRRFHTARDYSWHGQMTSVIAAGDGRTSGGKYRGIASDAHLVLIKVSNPKNRIKEADILRGMGWLIENHHRFNVRVLNISVGGDLESDDPDHPLHRAAKTLVEAGITILIAAGNSGKPVLFPPASAPEAITVGGVDDRNTRDVTAWRLYRSSYGTAYNRTHKPEIVAPAAWIPSPVLPGTSIARELRLLAQMLNAPDETTIRQLLMAGHIDLKFTRGQAFRPDEKVYALLQARINKHKVIDAHHQHVDGTSVASAVAASIVAQMLEANPRLTPSEVRAILTETAKLLPGVPLKQQGAGIIDAEAAVKAALQADTQAEKQ